MMVVVATVVTFILTAILASYLTRNYFIKKRRSLLFWSAGMWAFAIGVILEILFAFNIYNEPLIGLYLFVVGLLVNLLALGSIELVKSENTRWFYYVFSVITLAILAYSIVATNIGNLLLTYVVALQPPLFVVATSSLVTFPGVLILIVVAALSFARTRNVKMLSIIAGVVVVSAAGALYIVQFPAFLYYSEFIGILLLWFGFFDFNTLRRKTPIKRR